MLKGIDPLLTPNLLKVLAEMGHADTIVIADANFTAASLARGCHGDKSVIHLPGVDVERAARAVLSLLPLDAAVDFPVSFMQVSGKPAGYLSAQQRRVFGMLEVQGYATRSQCRAVERFAFYELVRASFAIVITGERQPYGNFLFSKGVIADDLVD